jgi:hypothetical protein
MHVGTDKSHANLAQDGRRREVCMSIGQWIRILAEEVTVQLETILDNVNNSTNTFYV